MNEKRVKISVVSPVYKAERIVDELCSRLISNLSDITSNFEIILIEDGSLDNSWERIVKNCKTDKRIKGMKLSRNFGQQHAIVAGLKEAKGDWVIVIDCDLQDRPDEIKKLYSKAQEGYDIVFAKRTQRQDNLFKKISSYLFFKTFSYFSGHTIDGSVANFGVYSKKVIDSMNSMNEPYSIFSVTSRWVGFNSCNVNVKHGKRFEGKSAYNVKALISFAFDYALTYSQKPLKMTIQLGFLISLSSFIYAIYFLTAYFQGSIKQPGFTSIIISIWLLSGVIIFILGIIGMYIGKTFENSKNKPRYLIDKVVN